MDRGSHHREFFMGQERSMQMHPTCQRPQNHACELLPTSTVYFQHAVNWANIGSLISYLIVKETPLNNKPQGAF